MAPLASVAKLATRWRHRIATLLWNALLALSVSIEFVFSSARVKSAQGVGLSQFERTGPIDRTPGTPGSDKKLIVEQKKS